MIGMEKPAALIFSGGGARGAYEIGVWQALRELDIQIDLVCGTSVGAINAALVVQGSFDTAVSVWKELETHMVFDLDSEADPLPKRMSHIGIDLKKLHHMDFDLSLDSVPFPELGTYAKNLFSKGGTSCNALRSLLRQHIDEAVIRESSTGYGLVTVELPSLNPKHLFKGHIPRGKLVDFILASASCFPAVQAYAIGETKYIDGGYKDNLPVAMALEKGFSQVIAVDLDAVGVVPQEPLDAVNKLLFIRCPWNLGNFLVFDKKNAARIMRLGYLDALKAFGFYDGSLYTFSKGTMSEDSLSGAEAAGKIFGLNPILLYNKTSFNHHLRKAILSHRKDLEESQKSVFKKLKNPLQALESLSQLIKNNVSRETAVLLLAEFMKEHPGGFSLPGNLSIVENLAKKADENLFRSEREAAAYLLDEGFMDDVLTVL